VASAAGPATPSRNLEESRNMNFDRGGLRDTLLFSVKSGLRFSDFTTEDTETTEVNHRCLHKIAREI